MGLLFKNLRQKARNFAGKALSPAPLTMQPFMQGKIIEMLAPARTDHAEYAAGEIYSVPDAVADRFVREKVAKYIEVSLDEPSDDFDPETGSDSEKPWRETLRPGDIFQWQVILNLPHFEQPRINPRFQADSEDYGE